MKRAIAILVWAMAVAGFVLTPVIACFAGGGGMTRLWIEGQQKCQQWGGCMVSQYWGSAVVVGRGENGRWLALTCQHNYDMARPWSRHHCDIRGKWRRVLTLDERLRPNVDVVVIGIECDIDLNCARLADCDINAGEAVTVYGYPTGQAAGVGLSGTATGAASGRVNGPVVPGWSGGGAFNAEGQLVGIVWGGSLDGECHWTPISTIRSILAERNWLAFCAQGDPTVQHTDPPPPPAQQPSVSQGDWATQQQLAAVVARLDSIEGTQRSTVDVLAKLDEKLTSETTRMDAAIRTAQGRPGPAGPAGPQGPPGPAGSPANVTALATEVHTLREQIDRLRAIDTAINVWHPDGTLAGTTTTNLFRGGAIDLRFNPRAVQGSADRE